LQPGCFGFSFGFRWFLWFQPGRFGFSFGLRWFRVVSAWPFWFQFWFPLVSGGFSSGLSFFSFGFSHLALWLR
jgi:hypothetical protein